MGADIRLAAYTIGTVCKSADPIPKIWGIVRIDKKGIPNDETQRFVQVGHSNGCAEGNAVPG